MRSYVIMEVTNIEWFRKLDRIGECLHVYRERLKTEQKVQQEGSAV